MEFTRDTVVTSMKLDNVPLDDVYTSRYID